MPAGENHEHRGGQQEAGRDAHPRDEPGAAPRQQLLLGQGETLDQGKTQSPEEIGQQQAEDRQTMHGIQGGHESRESTPADCSAFPPGAR
jgi:hypothetical protein